MIVDDPNVQRVEVVAHALGDLRDQLVLVGGSAASLLIDRATAPRPRVTFDVDLVAELTALRAYHALERAFEERGFKRDLSPDAPVCRWIVGAVRVDLMPTSETVLGFSNRWYEEAARTATRCTLPSGIVINLIFAPVFLATKLEAFDTRGRGDMAASHDFEDIINIVEGRSTRVAEVESASTDVREYLAARFRSIVASEQFTNTLPGHIALDELHAQRIAAVRGRLAQLIS